MKKSERLLIASLGALIVLFFSFQVKSIYTIENEHKERVEAILAENLEDVEVGLGSHMISLNKGDHGISNYIIDSEMSKSNIKALPEVVQPAIVDVIVPEPSVSDAITAEQFEVPSLQKGVITELHKSGFGWTVGQKVSDFKYLKTRRGINNHNSLTYTNVYANTDIQYTQVNEVRSMNINVNDASTFEGIPEEAEDFVFVEHIKLPVGWKASLKNNEVLITDKNKKLVMKYAAPTAKDASGAVQEGNYSIRSSKEGFVLQLAVGMDWLKASERAYPININPLFEMMK